MTAERILIPLALLTLAVLLVDAVVNLLSGLRAVL